MTRSLTRWVHRNLPRAAPPGSWRSRRSARVPPVHYLDKPLRPSLGATSLNPGVQFSMSKRVQFRTSVDGERQSRSWRHRLASYWAALLLISAALRRRGRPGKCLFAIWRRIRSRRSSRSACHQGRHPGSGASRAALPKDKPSRTPAW
jgi:hypothetical protein